MRHFRTFLLYDYDYSRENPPTKLAATYLSIRVVVIIENFLYFILYSRAHVICHSNDTCLATDKKHYN